VDKPPILAFDTDPSDALYRLRLARYVDLAERIDRLSSGRDRTAVLDLGCGKGRLRAYCRNVAAPLDWHGFDLQVWRIEHAREAGGYALARGDLTLGLPYRENAFDVVVCAQVLEHLDDLARPLAEVRRVLRPGGTFLLSLPTFPPLVAGTATAVMTALRKSRTVAERTEGGHVRFFSTVGIRRLLRGFDVRALSGQRVFSAKALENYRWFYRLNRFLGDLLPVFAVEVTAEAVKRP